MPYHIKFDRPPAGIALTSARKDEFVTVQTCEFTSTEDGQLFIKRLEGFVDEILGLVSPQKVFRPSDVDHLLAIIQYDGRTTAYINELNQIVSIRPKRAIKKGERVFKNDIIDIGEFHLDDIDVPNDAGVLFLFSIGWRKGLFFDFGPLSAERVPRTFSCERTFGQLYGYVMFQERFGITEADWQRLFQARWFPFAALRSETIETLLSHLRDGWDDLDVTHRIVDELSKRLADFLDAWSRQLIFAPHLSVLRHAIERFEARDFMSCSGLLYPRIEGILRTYHDSTQPTCSPSQLTLSQTAIRTRVDQPMCPLLPNKFQEYLLTVYFAKFNPVAQQIEFSRNSVAHGVAKENDFNAKSAAIAILVVTQLSYYLDNSTQVPTNERQS